MLNYELADKLKKSGYPQIPHGLYNKHGWKPPMLGIDIPLDDYAYFPTLLELIEACGEDFWTLQKVGDTWKAVSNLAVMDKGQGSTPEEAVANLWLELNKK